MITYPQRTRLRFFAIYFVSLMALSRALFNTWLPSPDQYGLWFYSAFLAFVAGILIDAPFHTTPGQALTASIVTLLGTLVYGLGTKATFDAISWAAWVGALALLTIALIASATAIAFKDYPDGSQDAKLGRAGYILAGHLARPAVLASIVFLFALIAYHRATPLQGFVLAIAWFILIFARPLENVTTILARIQHLWDSGPDASLTASVIGHAVPGLVTVRHHGPAIISTGTPLLVTGDDGGPNIALALGYVGLSDGVWLRAVQLQLAADLRHALPPLGEESAGCSVIRDVELLNALQSGGNDLFTKRDSLVGVVAPGSDTRTLAFEVVRADLALQEGALLEAYIGPERVMYQLLDGFTREDILHQKNTRGFVLGKARKVGRWDPAAQTFVPVRWLPPPNSPVFLVTAQEGPVDASAIGHFPGTSYPILCDPSLMVTHNTAVLGILGVGKTFLALELVERMILRGIRIICLDLTDQYERELAPYFHERAHREAIKRLQEIGKAGAANVKRNVQEGGSVAAFAAEVTDIIKKLLAPEGSAKLLVLNPNLFEVWRQDSKPYQDQASMVMLSPAEITRIVSEAALATCQELGITTQARCCLVYEEAHSLVPEWNAVANEGDKAASNGSARAILQGRKFGLGCLLITQRTASVTKTVLNQCNTVFAMRVFDATGMEFLSNYIGDAYAGILSGLPDRHAVLFGKASSAVDPVLIRVNDRSVILPFLRPAAQVQVPTQSMEDPAG